MKMLRTTSLGSGRRPILSPPGCAEMCADAGCRAHGSELVEGSLPCLVCGDRVLDVQGGHVPTLAGDADTVVPHS